MALKRALKYEEHTRRSDKRILECIREGETERKGEIKDKWKEHRKVERCKLGKSELVKIREESRNDIGKIMSRITERITSKEEEESIKKIRENTI